MEQKNNHNRGGVRPGSGRRPKKDRDDWGKVTCVLRKDTIQALREGSGGRQRHFGAFLQDHLDLHPLPSRETYLFRQKIKEIQARHGGIIRPNPERERLIRQLKRQERERLREERKLAKMTPKERAEYKRLQKGVAWAAKQVP